MSENNPLNERKLKTDSEASGGMPQGVESTPEIPAYVSEDIYRFWKNNGSRILIYSGIFLLAIIGTQSWKYLSVSSENNLKEEFAQLSSSEEMEAFANTHKSHSLAGYAYLQLAKEGFEAEDFEKAFDCYRLAEASLGGTDLEGIVILGQATSLEELDRVDEAVVLLESALGNIEFAKGIRAEAMFKRIVIAMSNGQDDVVKSFTAKLEAIDDTGIWTQRLRGIKNYQ